jgi:enoyl-CoA hydratase
MRYSKFSRLFIEQSGAVLTVSLNRPEALNAVDRLMHAELANIFETAALDDTVAVIVLTGAGAAFSAGGDLDFMQQMIDDPRLQEIEGSALAKRTILGLLECPKPIIAKVNGDAIGLGATLALFCDLIIAAEHARIGDPHVRMGLVAGDGGAVIWPQLVGFARAKEFLLFGTLLSASEAERIGLINHAVPASELDAKVDAIAAKLAEGARLAIGWTKTSVNAVLRRMVSDSLDASLALEAITMRSDDHQEAVAAFREHRKPRFTGR